MTDKFTDIMEKSMDKCYIKFEEDKRAISKCVVGMATVRGKMDKIKEQISHEGFKKALNHIFLDEITKDMTWNDVIGKPNIFEKLGIACFGGESLTDCTIRSARKFSLFKFPQKLWNLKKDK